jgi:hypothetical protein
MKGACNMPSGLSTVSKQLATDLRRNGGLIPNSGMPILFVLSIMPLIAQASQTRLSLSTEELKGLAPVMEAQEKNLKNIKIESEAWIERKTSLNDPCVPWQRTPIYVSCTSWFSEPPGTKARIDIHREVLEWIDGFAPYLEMSYSLSFNGQEGRVIEHTMKHNDMTFSIKEGKRMTDSPIPFRLGLEECTGIHFSYHYSIYRRGMSFSQLVRKASDDPDFAAKSELEFVLEEHKDGVNRLRINSGIKKKKGKYRSYLLDPSRGFALLEAKSAYIGEDGSEQVINHLEVSKLTKVAEDIWWPMDASLVRPCTSPKQPNKPYERIVYRASKITVNDPNFNEDVYTVPFPEGYFINDNITGRNYRVGQENNN